MSKQAEDQYTNWLYHERNKEMADNQRLRSLLKEAGEALRRLEPHLATKGDLLDNASLNEGRACEWDMASVRARDVLAKIEEELK